MDNAYATACAAMGLDPDDAKIEIANRALSKGSVNHSRDLDRILALPTRDWRVGLGGRFGTAEQLRQIMSLEYRRASSSPGPAAELRTVQAVALAEIHDFGGLLGPIPVGAGKTLISLLAPVVCAAERPLLLVPASLREKTGREWSNYGRDWQVPDLQIGFDGIVQETGASARCGPLMIESYQRLGTVSGRDFLDTYRPDLVLCDEAHFLANPKAAVTRRVRRYHNEHAPRFVFLTGSIQDKSMREYAHLADWALGEGSPLPRQHNTLLEWAAYFDEGVESRPQPGALVRLCSQDEQSIMLADPVTTIRRAFGRRLTTTPGVVSVAGEGTSASLLIKARHFEPASDELFEGVQRLRSAWELPDGQPLADAIQKARALKQLATGFYYRWKVQPPLPWMTARREWCAFVREYITNNRRGIDSELQVAQGCSAPHRKRITAEILAEAGLDPDDRAAAGARLGELWRAAGEPASWLTEVEAPKPRKGSREPQEPARMELLLDAKTVRKSKCEVLVAWIEHRAVRNMQPIDDQGAWARWNIVRPTFEPETEAIWVSEEVLEHAAEWLEREQGLVWVEHVAAGERLSQISGRKYFAGGPRAARNPVEHHDGPAIVSISANGTGKNLQKWSKSLVLDVPSSGKRWEQLLGRLHRPGQGADVVSYEVLLVISEQFAAFMKARGKAQQIQDTITTPQKLIYGDVDVVEPEKPGRFW